MIYNSKETTEVLKSAITKFGLNSQLDMLMEESIEVIQAYSEISLNPRNSILFDNLQGEIADLIIMVEQIKVSEYGSRIFKIKGELENSRFYGLFEHRRRIINHCANISLLIRKKLYRPDKNFDENKLIVEIAQIDMILDNIKDGDSIGVDNSICDAIKNLYLERIEKVRNLVRNN